MALLLRIFFGAAVSVMGFFVVLKAQDIVDLLDTRSEWVEHNFGIWGGMAGLAKIAGIIIIFVGFVIMTQLHKDLLGFIAGLVIPSLRQ